MAVSSSESITHLKLFLDQGKRQVALFSGPDEAQHWIRNMQADAVLQAGWHLLPRETLISVEEVDGQGFLRREALTPSAPSAADTASAWAMRAAGLATRLAEQAAQAGDPIADATCCERVVASLERAMAANSDPERHQDMAMRRSAWLLRAVNNRLEAWNKREDPEHAEALASLFAALADGRWHDGSSDRANADANHRFWRNQALRAWAQASQAAEERGDLSDAEQCSLRVLQLLDDQAA